MSSVLQSPIPTSIASPPVWPQSEALELDPELIPSIEDLVIDDGAPVDNRYVEKLWRLLAEALYASWTPPGGQYFELFVNVGLFFKANEPAIVPDVMLAIGIPPFGPMSRKENRSYFLWLVGKVPDLVLEIVSDTRGGEDTTKMAQYALLNIPYYVIYDPADRLHGGVLRAFALHGGVYSPISPQWIPALGLGLTLWRGEYQGGTDQWLRWCDQNGNALPNQQERAEAAKKDAESAAKQAALAVQQAELAKKQAEDAAKQAEFERTEKLRAQERLDQLMQQMKSLGVKPTE